MVSLVGSAGRQQIDLVVIPPDTDPVVAERALAAAAADNRLRSDEVLPSVSDALVATAPTV
jgi:hypothetical protein